MKKTITQNPTRSIFRSLVCAVFLLGLTATNLNAQVANYAFAQAAGTFNQAGLGADLTLSTTTYDDNAFTAATIPFTFTYHGVAFTTVGMSANGYAVLGGIGVTSPRTNMFSNLANCLVACNADLYALAGTAGHDMSYATVGSAPNRTFVMQWTNWGRFSSGLNEYSFQIRLNETTNSVQFVYGNCPAPTSATVSVGLSGATTADINVRTTTTNWAATTAGVTGNTCTMSSTIKPASGQTFTWTSAATAAAMVFTASAGTYVSIEAGSASTTLTTSTTNYDDDNFAAVTLPFAFNYHGTSMTTIGISSNVYAKLGAVTTTTYGNVLGVQTDILSPMSAGDGGTSFDGLASAANTAKEISYTTIGTTPNRTFVIQWMNWGFYSTGTADYSCQIRLQETTNTVKFVYGPTPGTNYPITTTGMFVGINGTTIADFNARTTTTNWTASTAATLTTQTCQFAAGVKPVQGLTYTFTPPAIALTSFAPTSGCPGTTSVVITGSGFTGATAVRFGGVNAFSYTVNSATQITAVPAATATGVITVVSPSGTVNSAGTFTINASPSVTVSPSSATICASGGTNSATLAASGAGVTTWSWAPSTGLSATNTASVVATPAATTTYTVTGTPASGCAGVQSVTVTVNTAPTITTLTATPSAVCAGSTATLAATSFAGAAGSATVGTTTTSIGGNTGNPYRSGNGTGNQIRTQLLYTAAELTAAGITAGPFTSIGFTTQTASTGTITNLSIAIGSTNVTALSTTYETSAVTTVFTQASFTPLGAGLNTHVFNAGSFTWDGVSNVLVNVCQTNSVLGTATVSAYTPATVSDNHTASSATSCSSLTGTTITTKPIVTFGAMVGTNITGTVTYTWNPGSLTGSTVTSPANAATTTYTVTASLFGCTSTGTTTVTVNPIVAGALTLGGATSCLGVQTVTAHPSGGQPAYTYSWTEDGIAFSGTGAGTATITATAGTHVYECTLGSTCAGTASSSLSVTTNALATVSPTSLTICAGNTGVATASPAAATSYAWTGGLGSAQTANVTTSGTYTVTVTQGTCVSTAIVTAVVNTLPVMGTTSASVNPVCSGSNTVLSSSASDPAGTYCTPNYTSYDGTDAITNVSLGTINNTTTNPALPCYSDFTGTLSTSLTAGNTYTISVTDGSFSSSENLAAWIDFNQNGTFEVGEQILANSVTSIAFQTFTATFTVPAGAANGTTRMRVADVYSATSIPCTTSGYGETEDYAIVISGGIDLVSYVWSPSTFLASTTGASVNANAVTSDVTYSVTATSGTTGCSNTGTVALAVNTAPAITSSQSNIMVSNDAGVCGAVVSYSAASVTGLPAPTVTYSQNSGTLFIGGTTTVTITASNSCGTVTSSFTVTVNDTEAPVISGNSATANSSDDATGDCAFTSGSVGPNVGSYTISGDNCSSSFTVQEDFFFNGNPDGTATWTLGAGTWFPVHTYQVGVTTVNVTVTDAAGNASTTSYTQTVIDNEAPIITVAAQDMTVQDDGAGNIADFNDWLITNWGNADATDNCTPGYILDYYWYNDYNPNNWVTGCGNTKSVYVGFYVHDISGNWSNWTYATFTIADNTAPVVTAPTDVTFCSASIGSIGTATATDNSLSTPLITNDAPASFPLGLTIVIWTATDACGNIATAAQNVMINETPVGSASSIVICNGDPSNVGLNSTVAGADFTWTSAVTVGGVIGNNDCTSGCGNAIADVLTNTGNVHGIVEYTVTPTSGLGCTGSPFTVDVTVGAAPAAPVILGPSVVCGLTTTTYSCAAVTEATSYVWTVPTGVTGMTITSGQGTNSINVTISAGTVSGNVTCTAVNNCGSSVTTVLAVTKKPAVPGAISGPTSTCGQTSATYSVATVFGATSYAWTLPAGMSGSSTTNTITVTIVGTFVYGQIKVSAVNACGNIPGVGLYVTGNVPTVPLMLGGPSNVCGLTSGTYSIPAVAGASGYNWTITGAGNSISGSNTGTTATAILAGPGTISVAATNLCGTGAYRAINLVTTALQPGVISGPLNTCGLTTATYSVAPVANASTYNWTLASGMTWGTGQGTNVISVNIAPSVGTVTATSTLKLTETNTCGNTSLFRTTTITRCLTPDAMATTEEGGNTYSNIYPNPTASDFTMDVTMDKDQDIILEVFDILGNVVISEKHNLVSGTSTMKTSLEQFNSGIYFVRLIDANSNVLHTERVIKQ